MVVGTTTFSFLYKHQIMKVIYNSFLPIKGFTAINLLGIIFIRKGKHLSEKIKNHETIHTAQLKELFVIFFYLFYVLEWIIKLFIYGKKSYRNISFEREAYSNENQMDYLQNRKPYAFLKRILR